MYSNRLIEKRVQARAEEFKTVLLTGARQVGKSTLLKQVFPVYENIVFDPIEDLWGARKDPALFLLSHPAPLILDEIQYSPEVLPGIKRIVDESDVRGQYLMTGSQNFSMMEHVCESLAGRVCVLDLYGMTPYEKQGKMTKHWLGALLQDPLHLKDRFAGVLEGKHSLYQLILRGGLPEALNLNDSALYDFHRSYLRTYLERDVRHLEGVQDLNGFTRFLALASALTAQEINFNQLGRELGISPLTAGRWLNILIAGYQWSSLEPFYRNVIKQISKKPKGHFADTGLACHLLGITQAEALSRHPMLGSLFETHCVNLVIALNQGLDFPAKLYHYRAHGGAEIDLILAQNGQLFPIEMKCATQLSRQDARGIHAFMDSCLEGEVPLGIILYPGTLCYYITEKVLALPYLAVLQ